MAVDYVIYPDKNLLIVNYSETFTIEDIAKMRLIVTKDPFYLPSLNVLEDVTRVEKVNADFDELSGISSKSIMAQGIKHCIVAETELQFAMSRMYQMLMESVGYELVIFRKLEEAKNWIIS